MRKDKKDDERGRQATAPRLGGRFDEISRTHGSLSQRRDEKISNKLKPIAPGNTATLTKAALMKLPLPRTGELAMTEKWANKREEMDQKLKKGPASVRSSDSSFSNLKRRFQPASDAVD